MKKHVNNSDTNFDEAVELIAFDPALTSKLLQICNSAYFGQESEVSSVADAANRVGYLDADAFVVEGKKLRSSLTRKSCIWLLFVGCIQIRKATPPKNLKSMKTTAPIPSVTHNRLADIPLEHQSAAERRDFQNPQFLAPSVTSQELFVCRDHHHHDRPMPRNFKSPASSRNGFRLGVYQCTDPLCGSFLAVTVNPRTERIRVHFRGRHFHDSKVVQAGEMALHA